MFELALQIAMTGIVVLFAVATLGANLFRRNLDVLAGPSHHSRFQQSTATEAVEGGPLSGSLLDSASSPEETQAA